MDRLFSLRADDRAVSGAGIKRNRGKVISAVLMSHTINALPESTGKTMPRSPQRGQRCVLYGSKDENTFLRVHDKPDSPDKRHFPYKKRIHIICHAVLLLAGSNNHLFSSNLAGDVCALPYSAKRIAEEMGNVNKQITFFEIRMTAADTAFLICLVCIICIKNRVKNSEKKEG